MNNIEVQQSNAAAISLTTEATRLGWFREIVAAGRFAPAAFLGLVLYAGLSSTQVLGLEDDTTFALWQQAYVNLGDLVLLPAIVISIIQGRVKLDKRILLFFLCASFAVLGSLWFGSEPYNPVAVRDAAIYLARFFLLFLFGRSLVTQVSALAAEGLLSIVFLILCATAIVVYNLSIETSTRMWASAMTVASFSQIAVIVSLLALRRKRIALLSVSVVFLLLSTSVTSTVLFLLIAAAMALTDKTVGTAHRIITLIVCGVVAVAVIYLAIWLKPYDIGYDLDAEHASTLHGRSDIWGYAVELLKGGTIGWLGAGFNESPALLLNFGLEHGQYVRHFHSLILEYAIDLGVLSCLILVPLLLRIGTTWRYRVQPAAAIYCFFLLSQAFDFTFYRPKEVILWSFVLGFAEGCWRLDSASQRIDPASPRGQSPVEDAAMYRIESLPG